MGNSDDIAEGIGKAFAGAALGFIVAFTIFRHPWLPHSIVK